MTKTNPETVREAHLAAFAGRMNMVDCSNHCGLSLREFKMTFREFLKYNESTYQSDSTQLELF